MLQADTTFMALIFNNHPTKFRRISLILTTVRRVTGPLAREAMANAVIFLFLATFLSLLLDCSQPLCFFRAKEHERKRQRSTRGGVGRPAKPACIFSFALAPSSQSNAFNDRRQLLEKEGCEQSTKRGLRSKPSIRKHHGKQRDREILHYPFIYTLSHSNLTVNNGRGPTNRIFSWMVVPLLTCHATTFPTMA